MKKCIIKIILMLVLGVHLSSTLFQTTFNKTLSKAQNYYKSTFGKNKTWNFLGYDLSEYPGTDQKYRKVNLQKWNDYYECLQAQNEMLGEVNTVVPDAVLGFEGGSVNFRCKICLSPKEQAKRDAVEWYWSSSESQFMNPVDYSEHILISPTDKTLSLYNLQMEQTGQYICKLGMSLVAPYFLTVVNSSINATEVHTNYASTGPFPRGQEYINTYNLVIDTQWTEWSSCSRCGKAGKRHKFGYCVVNKQNSTESKTSKKDFVKTYWHKSKTNKENETEELEIFDIMKSGIPCMSHILPEFIKRLPQILNRTIEIMLGYCKIKCKEETIFEVKDKDGNVIEQANNSAGIYSMLQGLPSVEPAVTRTVQYEPADHHIVISCPGNLNSDTPIQWQVDSKKLIPEIIVKQSEGRIYISVMDKVNIKKSKVSDSKTYSCWQNNELAGTVRLVVEKRFKITFNHHIMLFGMILILSVFLYVFIKAFFGRKHAKTIK